MEFNAEVGRRLRGEIAAGGSSIAGMAREIGVARSALDNYVTGKRAIPVPTLYSICSVLGLEPHRILGWAEERLRDEARQRDTNVIPLHPEANVPGRPDDVGEVAFDSPIEHDDDSDDLYD